MQLVRIFLEAEPATTDYGSYWHAAPVTWETHLRLKLYPIGPCGTAAGLWQSPSGWCPVYNNQISSWYAPRSPIRTFLLTAARTSVPLAVTGPSAAFGHPLLPAELGPFTVYVYGHDIAEDLHR